MTKTCRKCGTAFTDNLSVCPVCKTAIIQSTPEANSNVTASYEALRSQLELVKLKSRLFASGLFFVFGFLGLGWFYLGFFRRGMMHAILSLAALTLTMVLLPNQIFMVSLGLLILQTIFALLYLFNPDAKDARGELLK